MKRPLVTALWATACVACQARLPESHPVEGLALATCAKVRGDVQVRRAGTPYFQPLPVGAVLHAGDWVRTGVQSFARLAFLSGGELELEDQAAVVVDVATLALSDGGTAAAGPVVAVRDGDVHGFLDRGAVPLVLQGADGSRVRLAARGGAPVEYRIDVGRTGLDVSVLRGEATVSAGGVERSLREGQVSEIQGGTPGEPLSLIEFPESVQPGIDARFLFKADMRIPMAWSQVAGASGYRLQLARDLSFRDVELSLDTAATTFTFTPSAAGVYAWRVAARDGERRLGEFGFARRIFCEEEAPRELLLSPVDGAAVPTSSGSASVDFAWQSAAGARTYLLVVSREADLWRHPVVDASVADQRSRVPGLPPGIYWWGVYVAGAQPRPIFLKPRRFEVKRVAAAKLKTVKSIDEWGE